MNGMNDAIQATVTSITFCFQKYFLYKVNSFIDSKCKIIILIKVRIINDILI